MAYTFQQSGNSVAVFQDGRQIALATPDQAKLDYGYTGQPSLPPLSGTPTPSNQPAAPTPTAPSTPLPAGQASPLLSFANTLDQAVNLARQHRNELSLDLMKPLQGTVAASDFSSILGHLNTASDSTASDLIKQATKLDAPSYDTVTIGGDLYQVKKDATGKIVGAPTKVLSGGGGADGTVDPTQIDPSSTSILSQTGLSVPAFNFLTQGTASLTRLSAADRKKYMDEAQTFLNSNGIDISTFQSQYKAYNDVLGKNLARANQTKIMAGEVAGSADALISAINEKDMGNIKAANILALMAGQQVNDATTQKYSFQLKAMANDLAGYFAAARGATSPELQDQRDAAEVIQNGMSTRSAQAFKQSVLLNEDKVSTVVNNAVDRTRQQVWELFGVGDKYQSKTGSGGSTSKLPADVQATISQNLSFSDDRKTAYLPRAVWASLPPNLYDAILAESHDDGVTLLIK
jgi:hypothetical protein